MNNIYFLYGSDYEAIQSRINKLKVSQFKDQKIESFFLSKLDDISNFYDQSINVSLFNNNSLCLVEMNMRAFNQIDKTSDQFIQFVSNLSRTKSLILVLFSEKMDKVTIKKVTSSALFLSLKSLASIEEINKLFPWQVDAIKDRILSSAKTYGITFSSDALSLYIDHVKENLGKLNSELQLLQLFILPNNLVDSNTIKSLFNVDLNVDDMFDYLIAPENIDIAKFSSRLFKYESPLYLLAVIQNKIRTAINIKSYFSRNMDIYQISQILNINSYRLEKEVHKLRNLSVERLLQMISYVSDLEYRVKTGVINSEQAIDCLLIQSY